MTGATRDKKRVQQSNLRVMRSFTLGTDRAGSHTFLGVFEDALPPEKLLEKPKGLIETRLTNDLGAALLEDLGSESRTNM